MSCHGIIGKVNAFTIFVQKFTTVSFIFLKKKQKNNQKNNFQDIQDIFQSIQKIQTLNF
jgi:hypothetical protein